MSEKTIEEIINEETISRLSLMESDDYEFPAQLEKTDWILIVILIVVSIVLIGLCMTGVID